MKFITWLIAEIKKIWLLATFFAIAFLYILWIMKLYLKSYEIDTYNISKAIIGALFAAKAVLILDKTPLVRPFNHFPRVVNLLYRTFLYSLAVILLGNLEAIIHAFNESHNWQTAWSLFLSQRDINRFWATNLCLALVFLFYNSLAAIEAHLGQGWLVKFLFQPAIAQNETQQTSELLESKDSSV